MLHADSCRRHCDKHQAPHDHLSAASERVYLRKITVVSLTWIWLLDFSLDAGASDLLLDLWQSTLLLAGPDSILHTYQRIASNHGCPCTQVCCRSLRPCSRELALAYISSRSVRCCRSSHMAAQPHPTSSSRWLPGRGLWYAPAHKLLADEVVETNRNFSTLVSLAGFDPLGLGADSSRLKW